MLKHNQLIKELLKVRRQMEALKKREEELKRQLLEGVNVDKLIVDEGDNRVAVYKVRRIKIADIKALPEEYKTEVIIMRPNIKKIRANIEKLKGLIEEVEDIQIRITSRNE